jgi:hypothetical protein
MKTVTCKSGLRGWRGKLQQQYASFEEFQSYAELYGLHRRLGYKSIRVCWEANPTVQGSVEPSDFRKVKP